MQAVRRGWQRAVRDRLRMVRRAGEAAVHRILRERLARWSVPVLPGRRPARAQHNLLQLGSRVPPRVQSACLRALLNGWATERRMQLSHTRGARGCMFGCDAPDSIEHYANCRVVSDFSWARLGLRRMSSPSDRLAQFLLLDRKVASCDRDRMVRQAIRLAMVYKVHNLCLYIKIACNYHIC